MTLKANKADFFEVWGNLKKAAFILKEIILYINIKNMPCSISDYPKKTTYHLVKLVRGIREIKGRFCNTLFTRHFIFLSKWKNSTILWVGICLKNKHTHKRYTFELHLLHPLFFSTIYSALVKVVLNEFHFHTIEKYINISSVRTK